MLLCINFNEVNTPKSDSNRTFLFYHKVSLIQKDQKVNMCSKKINGAKLDFLTYLW